MADEVDHSLGKKRRAESESDDDEAMNIALKKNRESNEEFAAYVDSSSDDALIKASMIKLWSLAKNQREVDALKTLVYVRSKGHIYVELRDSQFYCMLCNIGFSSTCLLYQHLAEAQHKKNLSTALDTIVAFPYNDGILFFQNDRSNLDQDLIVDKVTCTQTDCRAADIQQIPLRFSPRGKQILIEQVLMYNKTEDVKLVLDVYGLITAQVSEMGHYGMNRISCKCVGDNYAEDRSLCNQSIVTFVYKRITGICPLCENAMTKGMHASILLNGGRFVIHSNERGYGLHFHTLNQDDHLSHTSCLIHWVLLNQKETWTSFMKLSPSDESDDHRKMYLKGGLLFHVNCPACPVNDDMDSRKATLHAAQKAWKEGVAREIRPGAESSHRGSTGLCFSDSKEKSQDVRMGMIRFYRVSDDDA